MIDKLPMMKAPAGPYRYEPLTSLPKIKFRPLKGADKMEDFIRNKWMPAGNTDGGWENIPLDGTPFLISHPWWACPAVAGYSTDWDRVLFLDPDLNSDPQLDYIVDFTDMMIFIYDEAPHD